MVDCLWLAINDEAKAKVKVKVKAKAIVKGLGKGAEYHKGRANIGNKRKRYRMQDSFRDKSYKLAMILQQVHEANVNRRWSECPTNVRRQAQSARITTSKAEITMSNHSQLLGDEGNVRHHTKQGSQEDFSRDPYTATLHFGRPHVSIIESGAELRTLKALNTTLCSSRLAVCQHRLSNTQQPVMQSTSSQGPRTATTTSLFGKSIGRSSPFRRHHSHIPSLDPPQSHVLGVPQLYKEACGHFIDRRLGTRRLSRCGRHGGDKEQIQAVLSIKKLRLCPQSVAKGRASSTHTAKPRHMLRHLLSQTTAYYPAINPNPSSYKKPLLFHPPSLLSPFRIVVRNSARTHNNLL